MTTTLYDRVAVVTGASSGIGRAVASRLARAGMSVVAVARREELLSELAAGQPRIHPHVADVTVTTELDDLAARVRDEFGACHALINNAGVGGGPFRGREDLDDALHTLDVNLGGTIRAMAAFAELLEQSAPSRVVNIGSVAGRLGVGPAGYAASKFGTVGFSEATRLSWADRGVTVCQVNPGLIETEGFPQTRTMDSALARIVGEPQEVARAVHRTLLDGARERVVPGWYRLLIQTRHLAGTAFWWAAARTDRARGSRD